LKTLTPVAPAPEATAPTPPSAEEQALLDTITAKIDDDEPRLVYADWLIQRGDPRGELIALQCGGAAQRKLKVSENKLLKEHELAWSMPVRAALPPPVNILDRPKIVFRRGFVDEIHTSGSALDRLDQILDAAPALTRLRVEGVMYSTTAPTPDELLVKLRAALENPRLSRLRGLDLRIISGDAVALAVAACPHLAGLRELTLRVSMLNLVRGQEKSVLGAVGVTALARSPYLSKVTRLALSDNPLGGDAIAAVLAAPWPLEELDLSHDRAPKGIDDAFAASKRAPTLKRLVLEDTKLTTGFKLDRMFGAPCLANLEELQMELAHIGPKGVKPLLDKLPPKVVELGLARNALADAGVAALAAHPRVATLKTLFLGHNRLGAASATALAGSPHIAKVEKIYLAEPRFKEDQVAELSKLPGKIFHKGKLVSTEIAEAATEGRSSRKGAPSTSSKPSTSPKRGSRRSGGGRTSR
jgi:uncharacterized protein (TIGR02996 family)